jgi:hypothetical protein
MDDGKRAIDANGLPVGADILDNAGELVGSLDRASSQVGYLTVMKGIFFTKNIFLPLSAVDHASDDGIYLNVSKDELQDSRFEGPPTVPGDVS